MPVPYEASGRRAQKARTREALVAAARQLLADGHTPTVEQAAAAAGISRTTAYRYTPNQRALLIAAHPEIEDRSLLPDGAPTDPQARLALVMQEFTRRTLEWEPQLRAWLRLALAGEPETDQVVPRQAQAVGWIEEALAPVVIARPELDVHRLALAIRSATGVEALLWLTDVAGLTREAAAYLMRWSARAMLQAALSGAAP